MAADRGGRDRRFQLAGWMLFVVSAIFFIASSLESRNPLGLAGGIFFLLACVVFLIPYAGRRAKS